MMAEAGIHPKVMQEIFGWSTMRMAERYINLGDRLKVDAVEAVAKRAAGDE